MIEFGDKRTIVTNENDIGVIVGVPDDDSEGRFTRIPVTVEHLASCLARERPVSRRRTGVIVDQLERLAALVRIAAAELSDGQWRAVDEDVKRAIGLVYMLLVAGEPPITKNEARFIVRSLSNSLGYCGGIIQGARCKEAGEEV